MALELRQSIELRQDLRLEQRLEQKQQLQLQLQQTLQEWDFIAFESDENLPLLATSLPFMMYHEVSHPLHDAGKVQFPQAAPIPYGQIDGQPLQTDYVHHALEVGIDGTALLIGKSSGLYSLQDLVISHAAVVERVVRDMIQDHSIGNNYPFLARLQAELEVHGRYPEAKSLMPELKDLAAEITNGIRFLSPDERQAYGGMVHNYQRVYQNVRFV